MGSSATWLPQDPVPSRAARRRSPAQRLRDELRPLLGESWSEELERDVPHAWQRHGDLVLLSQDSFRAAAWESLGKGSPHCPSAGPVLPRCWPGAAPVLARCWPAAAPVLPSFPRSPRMVCCRLGALGDGGLGSGGPAGGQARPGDAGRDADPQGDPAAGPARLGGAHGQRHQVGRSCRMRLCA